MGEGTHHRLQLIESIAVTARDVQRSERRLARLERAIEGERVMQAVHRRR